MTRAGPAVYLALNGALLMLAGLFLGAAMPAVPYPRLMVAAHSAGFTASGLLSMAAGLLLSSSLCAPHPRAAGVVIWGHVALWPLSLSEVAAAFWERPRPSGSPAPKAGATGGARWQETIVIVCRAVPAIALMAAWGFLASGVWEVFRRHRTLSNEGVG